MRLQICAFILELAKPFLPEFVLTLSLYFSESEVLFAGGYIEGIPSPSVRKLNIIKGKYTAHTVRAKIEYLCIYLKYNTKQCLIPCT